MGERTQQSCVYLKPSCDSTSLLNHTTLNFIKAVFTDAQGTGDKLVKKLDHAQDTTRADDARNFARRQQEEPKVGFKVAKLLWKRIRYRSCLKALCFFESVCPVRCDRLGGWLEAFHNVKQFRSVGGFPS